ncbi:MAG: cytochrome c [Aliishimia sp.]
MPRSVFLVMSMLILVAAVLGYRLGVLSLRGERQSGYTPNVIRGAALAKVRPPTNFDVADQHMYSRACAACHGHLGEGKDAIAPPLVHMIYGPERLSNMQIEHAIRHGVGAHHWPFGNMPAIEGVNDAQVAGIVRFVRTLQRANGIE